MSNSSNKVASEIKHGEMLIIKCNDCEGNAKNFQVVLRADLNMATTSQTF